MSSSLASFIADYEEEKRSGKLDEHERRWDELFSISLAPLDALAKEAEEAKEKGLCEDLDPNTI